MENLDPIIQDRDLVQLDALAKVMDSQFRIPGTQMRFGLDPLLGLIPYAGDLAGFLVSGLLVRTMIRRGAGPLLMLRMLGNVVLDTLIGTIPLLGDLFDFGFKANRRNVQMLQRYYAEGKARPDAKRSAALLGVLFLLILLGLLWGTIQLAAWLAGWLWAQF